MSEIAAAAPKGNGRLAGMLKNASASLIGNILSIPLQFLGFIIAARSLGPAVFGQYSFAQELTLFVIYAADGGLNIIVTREIARDRARAGVVHATVLKLKVGLSAVCYMTILGVGLVLSDGEQTFAAVAILGLANIMLSYVLTAYGVFRGCERMVWEGVAGLLQPVCFCLFTAFVAYSGVVHSGLLPMALARLASYVPVVALVFIVSLRLAPLSRTTAPGAGREFLRQGLPIALLMFVFDALLRCSVLFLQAWATSIDLSMFTVASRIVYSLWLIPYILAGAWLPVMARCAAGRDEAGYAQHLMRLVRLLCIAAAPLTVMLYLAAEPVILLLFGPDYRAAAGVLRVLALVIPFLFLYFGMKTSLEARNRQRPLYAIVLLGLVAALGANAWFVGGGMGAQGAAWAYFCGLSASTVLGYMLIVHDVSWGTFVLSLVRVGAAAAVAGVTLHLLLPGVLLLALAVSGTAYLASLFLLGELHM
jgi:Membrane protein involved in the export of O-antigen and teichoic acid